MQQSTFREYSRFQDLQKIRTSPLTAGRDVEASLFSAQETVDEAVVYSGKLLDPLFSNATTPNNEHVSDEISPYYTRDPNDKDTGYIVDKNGLRQRLQERFEARRAKRFDHVEKLDRILLRDFGVRVFDNPNIWTCRRSSKTGKPPAAYMRRRERAKLQKLKAIFGPTGHPYCRVGGPIDSLTCSLSMTEIHTLLSQVQLSRMEGHHENADATVFELQLHGVEIFEPWKCWRADGRSQFDGREKPTSRADITRTYQMVGSQEPTSIELKATIKRVEQLVSERAEAIVREEDEIVQFLALELFRTYNVGIEDGSRSYSFRPGTDFSKVWSPPVPPSDTDSPMALNQRGAFPPLLFLSSIGANDENTLPYSAIVKTKKFPLGVWRRVEQLITQRAIKVEENKTLEADSIEKELQATYGVVMDDSKLEWIAL